MSRHASTAVRTALAAAMVAAVIVSPHAAVGADTYEHFFTIEISEGRLASLFRGRHT